MFSPDMAHIPTNVPMSLLRDRLCRSSHLGILHHTIDFVLLCSQVHLCRSSCIPISPPAPPMSQWSAHIESLSPAILGSLLLLKSGRSQLPALPRDPYIYWVIFMEAKIPRNTGGIRAAESHQLS